MEHRLDEAVLSQLLEVPAGFTERHASAADAANVEALPHEMVQRDPAGRHVAAVLAGSQFDVELAADGVDRFGLDERQVLAGPRGPGVVRRAKVAVAADPPVPPPR